MFIYFLDPAISWIAIVFFQVSKFLSQLYIDEIFSESALLVTIDHSLLLHFAITFLMIGITYIFGMKIIKIKYPVIIDSESEKTTKSKIMAKLDPIFTKKPKIPRVFFISFMTIYFVLYISIYLQDYIEHSIISSFQQHVRILSPYLKDGDEKILYSKWSAMESESDYNSIYFLLDGYAREHNLILPKNRIYNLGRF